MRSLVGSCRVFLNLATTLQMEKRLSEQAVVCSSGVHYGTFAILAAPFGSILSLDLFETAILSATFRRFGSWCVLR